MNVPELRHLRRLRRAGHRSRPTRPRQLSWWPQACASTGLAWDAVVLELGTVDVRTATIRIKSEILRRAAAYFAQGCLPE